ncbi:hypothetical protein [Ruminococcus albus]|uniref:Lipoprotein n=1 Tax=Ruminococcus albus TaxID=1264 RepID=A0A1I1L6M3_RUMAL|nr:hypothetical protein [Ruminococcus albus]SFC68661.1 hypothetical protein SAMN02910406_02168 [Ruminococcus albus]
MKKMIALTAAVVFALGLTACGNKKELAEKSQSTVFTEEDFCEAQADIKNSLKDIDCVTLNIDYDGDEVSTDEDTLATLNNDLGLRDDERYTDCMVFTVDYRQSYSPLALIKATIRSGNACVDISERKMNLTLARKSDGNWETANVSYSDAG